MKLYVWHEVFVDYSAGVAFALANNAEEAVSVIRKAMGNAGAYDFDGIKIDGVLPVVYDSPVGFVMYGGQ